jgi:predicted nucleic acid-binding protein
MRTLAGAGCDTMDAFHIACAERAGSILLTTDDDLITVNKVNRDIQVSVENPVTWLKRRTP